LVDLVNLDPRRGEEYSLPMSKMKLNSTALVELAEQGYQPSSVPPKGAEAFLHRHGEYTTDVTDHVHPEVAARAILATRVVGLDVAGIDMVIEDIGHPMEEQGGMVIEVNAGPQLQMHAEPQVGRARPVGAAIVETLYPVGQTGRIPLVAVTSGPTASLLSQMAAHLMRNSGLTVGLACTAGTFVGDRRLSSRGPKPPGRAELFLNPLIQAAVFEVSATGVYNEGLGFDDCDVAVISPLQTPQETPVDDVHEPDTWRRIVVENVSPLGTVVLAADDPDAPRLAESCRGAVLYYQIDSAHPRLTRHRTTGGKVVFVRDALIWAASGKSEFNLGPWTDSSESLTRAALAGVAAAWSAGMPVESIEQGLLTLGSSPAGPFSATLPGQIDAAACTHRPRPN
jgi:cyanophycin synthetase